MRKIIRFLKRKGYVINIITLLMLIDNIAFAAIDVQMYMMYESIIIRVLIGILGMLIITYVVYLVISELDNHKYERKQELQINNIKQLNQDSKNNYFKLDDYNEMFEYINLENQRELELKPLNKGYNQYNAEGLLIKSDKDIQIQRKDRDSDRINRNLNKIKSEMKSFAGINFTTNDFGINNVLGLTKDIYLATPELKNIETDYKETKQNLVDLKNVAILNNLQKKVIKETDFSKQLIKQAREYETELTNIIQETLVILNAPKKRGRKKKITASSRYDENKLKNAEIIINSEEEYLISNEKKQNIIFKEEAKEVLNALFEMQDDVIENTLLTNELKQSDKEISSSLKVFAPEYDKEDECIIKLKTKKAVIEIFNIQSQIAKAKKLKSLKESELEERLRKEKIRKLLTLQIMKLKLETEVKKKKRELLLEKQKTRQKKIVLQEMLS